MRGPQSAFCYNRSMVDLGEQKHRLDEESPTASSAFWRVFAALALVLSSTSFMNVSVFPLFDHVFGSARDISILLNAATLVIIGVIATFKPSLLRAGALNALFVACLIVGGALLPVSLGLQNGALLVAASGAVAIGRAWCTLVVGIAVSKLGSKAAMLLISLAFLVQTVFWSACWLLPIWFGMIGFLACPLLAWVLSWHDASSIFEETQAGEAPNDFSVTQPSSFLPLASQFFVCLFLFRVAFGCSLRFGEVEGAPLSSFASIIPVAIVAAIVLFSKRKTKLSLDFVVQISVLFVVAGFLFMPLVFATAKRASVAMLSMGNTLFDMVAWLALIAVAVRNSRAAVATFAWGRGVSGLGSIVGAAIGIFANDLSGQGSQHFSLFAAVLALAFVAYALFGLRKFSFEEVVEGVVPTQDVTVEIPKPTFDDRCAEIAERFDLTARELEVFKMLARGRDRTYIQEQLVISRNTVKSHVKHIYTKLDVHSQQDLIDLIQN